ncbi:MAG: PHA/PHB synthase family protein [Marinibacterium sp.]
MPESKKKPETVLDTRLHASEARVTGGLSPVAAYLAWTDWALHLANAPGKLSQASANAILRGLGKDVAPPPEAPVQSSDHRFDDPAWSKWPFAGFAATQHLAEDFWDDVTTGVPGISRHHENMTRFGARQWLDMLSPSNFPATNPEVIAKTVSTGGMNLVTGMKNLIEDTTRYQHGDPPVGAENFQIGRNVAATPGKVIFRNELIELIQYAPATDTVFREPVLFVPNWIMKYYILDLSQSNSMVRYLVEQGHRVFMISWKNPGEDERDFGMDTYVERGALAAMEAVREVMPDRKINTVGYCIGGTLLALTAAYLGATGKDWLSSITLFAAQIDFTEAGEIMLFVDEEQVDFIEDMMESKGYLDGAQMAGAFQMLRSNDLIWSRNVHAYLMGDRPSINDLMAWNADTTRMPARMHSEYLRRLFQRNDFAEGRMKVLGKAVAPRDIRPPIFQVGTEKDHVAPWHSVYKVRLMTDTEITFLLTSGGHNAGVISEPGHRHRHYRVSTVAHDAPYVSPEDWFAATPVTEGSWWPRWQAWLAEHSGDRGKPPAMGNAKAGLKPLCDAPGSYVLER